MSPAEVDCRPFTGQPGERIRLTAATPVYGSTAAWLTDATGARVCPRFPEDGEDSCVLTGSGPYRVICQVTYSENGFPAGNAVTARRLTDPQGCATAPVRPYGALAPQDLTADGCYTFTTGKAGPHTVHYVGGVCQAPHGGGGRLTLLVLAGSVFGFGRWLLPWPPPGDLEFERKAEEGADAYDHG
ncbi:hypothetical protein [Streptomyces sp. NPDC086777]|uniref:hypothetical protein n=1 Tax=Streptomyces sp. NPDC086777 TaxID=3154866 RepID=UPI00344B4DEA